LNERFRGVYFTIVRRKVEPPFYLRLTMVVYTAREDAVRLRRLVNMESGKKTKAPPRVDDDDEPDEHSGVDSFKQVSVRFKPGTVHRS
jgi:hypothetical protein